MTYESPLFHIDADQPFEPNHSEDPGLDAVEGWIFDQRDLEKRFGQVFRRSIDEVLDGQRTGRYDLYIKTGQGRVESTEKTYLGTKVEIVTRAEFDLGYGSPMDYVISGQHVDAKFTMGTTWMIPKEAMSHICLLMRADDKASAFQVGLLRITPEVLTTSTNGDQKWSVSAFGKSKIRWIIQNGELPKNLLLSLKKESPGTVDAIFRASKDYHGSGNGGQLRVNELFRRVRGRLVDRTTVVTVATQQDSPKRVRDARTHLKPDGIIVLGHTKPSPQIADQLGLPRPDKGFWVSAKLTVLDDHSPRRSAVIGGTRYGIWEPGDPPCEAPRINQETEE
ncbi:NaeI family type II restriction endonuclease [Kitasatospora sp. YST-16]|uniref:NaeI family type II restriction endonuclease n=1 Tax=Kitasatospora sp. YST-16 TaxID=2998080 RepID=UPI002284A216|nr:NaeI family type II restriction endonuclease [Kitasatospora sp. YST-16]WAL72647.1 NaeI family type II restriction endonuclease [Kitasatospora sp. YST-16]WNW38694.1 NaeI family type II restriction endonuclease [Streptomyces sp. Li-HN-5-13]